MIAKPITYTDPFTDEVKTENFYFNLTAAEVIELQMSVPGGLNTKFQQIIDEEDPNELIKHFKWFILKSYGVRTKDGKWVKSKKAVEEFKSSAAYSALFMELAADAKAGAEFVNGLLPKDLQGEVAKMQEKQKAASLQPTLPEEGTRYAG